MYIKHRNNQGYGGASYLNFDTATIYVPNPDDVHNAGSIDSITKIHNLNPYSSIFEDVTFTIGQNFDDSFYTTIDGVKYATVQVYLPEPHAIGEFEVEEMYSVITYKKIY
jgi:hypothetical protein